MTRVIVVTTFFCGLLLTIAQAIGLEEPVVASVLWGCLILWLSGYLALMAEKPFDLFSPAFLTNAFIFVSFGVPLVLSPLDPVGPGTLEAEAYEHYYPVVGAVVFWCVVGLNFGYRIVFVDPKILDVSRFFPNVNWQVFNILWWSFAFTGVIGAFYSIIFGVFFQTNTEDVSPLVGTVIATLRNSNFLSFTISVTICAALRFRDIKWLLKLVFSALMLLIVAVPSGSKLLLATPFILIAVVYNYNHKLINRKQAVVGILLFILAFSAIYPINQTHRDALTRESFQKRVTVEDAVSHLGDSVALAFDLSPSEYSLTALDFTWTRFNSNKIVAAILEYQDSGGPFRYGETYARFLFGPIPRVFWPDKPDMTIGGEMTTVVLGKSGDTRTSTGATIPGEAVYNFGPIFAPFVVILLGMLFKLVYVLFRRIYDRNPYLAIVLYMMVWTDTLFPIQESSFAHTALGSVKHVGLLWIYLTILSLGFREIDKIHRHRRAKVDVG